MHTKLNQVLELVGSIAPPEKSISSTNSIAGLSTEDIRSVVRLELEGILYPILNNISHNQSSHEKLSLDINALVDTLSMHSDMHNTSPSRSTLDATGGKQRKTVSKAMDHMLRRPRDSPSPAREGSQYLQQTTSPQIPWEPGMHAQSIWVYWRRVSWIGTIRIEIKRYSTNIGDRRAKYTSFWIRFWPSCLLVNRKCISLLYSTQPFAQVYYQLAPLISIFPVIPADAEVWKYIQHGDITGLRRMLSHGLTGPNDQEPHGYTLLHVRTRAVATRIRC